MDPLAPALADRDSDDSDHSKAEQYPVQKNLTDTSLYLFAFKGLFILKTTVTFEVTLCHLSY